MPPFYQYQCQSCDHKFEELQKISSKPLILCPVCEESQLRRLPGTPGIIFKGTGWTPKHYPSSSSER